MRTIHAILLSAAILPSAGAADAPAKRIPVILDSDIGDDIDDTWALALLLRSPELDLKLFVTDYGKPEYRAKVAAKVLEAAGRTDVAVGLGIPVKGAEGDGGQGPWVKDYDLSKYPGKVHKDGVQALIDAILGSKETVTLICIGPLPTVRAALAKEPGIAKKARFVGMHGSVFVGYGGKKGADAEWNVKADPAACREVLGAPWEVRITPLDTCGLVQLRGEKYAAVRDSKDPLTKALVENYRIWCGKNPESADRESSTLFDTVAVYLAMTQDLCVMKRMGIRVTDEGMTVPDEKGKATDCAVEWKDLKAFEDFLVKRLAGKG